MNNIKDILQVIDELGGSASAEEITKALCKKKKVMYDGCLKTIVLSTLNSYTKMVSYSNVSKKWKTNKATNDNGVSYWIRSADSAGYDHKGSFDKNGVIDWTQNGIGYKVGDIVYIYYSGKQKKIGTKCIVERIDIPSNEKIDDLEFCLTEDMKNKTNDNDNTYVRYKRIKEYDGDELSYAKLKAHGVKSHLQGPMKIDQDLADYIEQYFAD